MQEKKDSESSPAYSSTSRVLAVEVRRLGIGVVFAGVDEAACTRTPPEKTSEDS